MSAPTQSNPAYKQRLVDVMLKEPASRRVPGLSSIFAVTWSPRLVAAVAGLALLSAVSVFLFLFHHDSSAGSVASPLVIQTAETGTAHRSPELSVASNTVPVTADHKVSSSAPLDFQLKRSRSFEQVGPIGIRLLRVNQRRRTCDLTMRLNDHRTVQRRLQLNRPLEVRQEPSAEPLQIVVSSIARNSIAGVVASRSADSTLSKQIN